MNQSRFPRYAIVTGGASGLGREFCVHLGRSGCQVGIVDVNEAGAERTLELVRACGGDGRVAPLDVTDATSWSQLIAKLRIEWPRLDLLINNAGVCGAGRIGEFSLDEVRRIVEVNLFGVINGCHVVAPWMLETAPGGHIVNIASIAPSLSAPTMAAYNCAKAAVISLSETLHAELRPRGVGVLAVMPGFFQSELLQQGTFDDERMRDLADRLSRNSDFTACDVVTQTMRGIALNRLQVVVGRKARLAWHLKRLAPRLFHRYVTWSLRRKIDGSTIDTHLAGDRH
jgi:NAD(P)-dependent dehydrogenase (short-subunit alcohol dehydrogenase family)